jgi:hypothetical protein
MKKPVEAFAWRLEYQGEAIEKMLITMCVNYPLIMIDVLKIGFGDLERWFGTDNFATARCGCLVGSMALAARKHMSPEQIEAVMNKCSDGPDPLVAAIEILYKQTPPDGFRSELSDVGNYVSNEGNSEYPRQIEVKSYILDLIRVNLTLAGHTRLPKSPAIV